VDAFYHQFVSFIKCFQAITLTASSSVPSFEKSTRSFRFIISNPLRFRTADAAESAGEDVRLFQSGICVYTDLSLGIQQTRILWGVPSPYHRLV
jgi:hypothetical protein